MTFNEIKYGMPGDVANELNHRHEPTLEVVTAPLINALNRIADLEKQIHQQEAA